MQGPMSYPLKSFSALENLVRETIPLNILQEYGKRTKVVAKW